MLIVGQKEHTLSTVLSIYPSLSTGFSSTKQSGKELDFKLTLLKFIFCREKMLRPINRRLKRVNFISPPQNPSVSVIFP